MARPTQAWHDRDPSARRAAGEHTATGLRAVFDRAWHRFSAASRAAKAADARRAARCEEANEPLITATRASAAFASVTAASFVVSPPSLAADRRAPSWNPELDSPAQREAGAAARLQNVLMAAARKLGRSDERIHPARTTTRDPYFTPSSAENANLRDVDDAMRLDRKRAAR